MLATFRFLYPTAKRTLLISAPLAFVIFAAQLEGQTSPIWSEDKVLNYLPHMTRPEVEDLLTRTDMVIIPVASLEQHGLHLPIGTDYISGVERAKLIAQRTDALVAPILLPGQSPYHMEFAGTVTLPAELIQEVYVEATKSLIRHGFKRFLFLNAHGGNRAITTFIVDRVNQETEGIAVDLGSAAGPYMERSGQPQSNVFDRHGGVSETSRLMYLAPNLVNLDAAETATLSMPDHLQAMVPLVLAGDPAATTVFLAEGLKATETGKGTSAADMSSTGVWGERDLQESNVEYGEVETMRFVEGAVRFMERWKELRPMN
ncbi:MAG: creatininase family protein [Gemmatimonadota bacterium]|nr:creatininase family protein [Gemmatimonadota bacterium]